MLSLLFVQFQTALFYSLLITFLTDSCSGFKILLNWLFFLMIVKNMIWDFLYPPLFVYSLPFHFFVCSGEFSHWCSLAIGSYLGVGNKRLKWCIMCVLHTCQPEHFNPGRSETFWAFNEEREERFSVLFNVSFSIFQTQLCLVFVLLW